MALLSHWLKVRRLSQKALLYWRSSDPAALDRLQRDIIGHLWRTAADRLGLTASPFGRAWRIERPGSPDRPFHVNGVATDFDVMPLASLASDKIFTRSLFEEAGLPVPAGRTFSWDEARQAALFAASLGGECVVKPASGTSTGVGVAVGLRTPAEVRRAFAFAGLFSSQILVEAQARGDSYRLLVFRDRCLSVIRRELPTVTADGCDDIRTQVARMNEHRIRKPRWSAGDPFWMPVPMDATAQRALGEQDLKWTSVPPAGRTVRLSGIANFRTGCTFSECGASVHPDICASAVKATALLGLELAGVDAMAADISAPAHQLLEINTTPYLPMHYLIRNPGEGVDPILTILAARFGIALPGRPAG